MIDSWNGCLKESTPQFLAQVRAATWFSSIWCCIFILSFYRPLYPDCEFNLGNLYLKTRNYEEAERRFRLGAQHDHELSHVNLIILLDERSRLGEAQDLTLQAIRKFPDNPEFLFQYANILGQQVTK